ncbi:MAG: putative collagen-binding domain-containing protein, partial [Bacteroidota bacterium]
GMNSISMSLFGGDALNVYPWRVRNNTKQYDVSKLAQWEIVFNHAERKGLLLHFKLSEVENCSLTKREFPGVDRSTFSNLAALRVYYREMIARFGHHLAVEWNIGEEFKINGTPQQEGVSAIPGQNAVQFQARIARIRANYLATMDPYKSHRVIHNPGNNSPFQSYINGNVNVTGFSFQSSDQPANLLNFRSVYISPAPGQGADLGIKTWINKNRTANRPLIIAIDEQNPGSTGPYTNSNLGPVGPNFNNPAPVNTPVRVQARTRILWKALMAGGAGVMWYAGGGADFRTDDFRRFNPLFNWSRFAVQFFENNNIPFWNMRNRDDLIQNNTNSFINCFAQPGQHYVIYLEWGGSANLNLNGVSGSFQVRWFNPRNGGSLKNGNVIQGGGFRSIGTPPNSPNADWVAYVSSVSATSGVVAAENIAEISKDGTNEFIVHPNPMTGKSATLAFDQEISEGTLRLYNEAGHEVYETTFSTEKGTYQLDIDSSLSDGNYIIRVSFGARKLSARMVVE